MPAACRAATIAANSARSPRPARSRTRRAGRGSPAWRSPSSWSRRVARSGGSSAIEVTGSSSTAVTPIFLRCSTTAGCAMPRYVPRCSAGTSGCSFVQPRTCASRITVSDHGTSGRGSAASSSGAVTTDSGTCPSESTVLSMPSHRVVHPPAGRLQVGDAPDDPPGVRVDEDLGRVGAHARPRPVGPVHPVAVALACADAGDVAVPDAERLLGERDAPLGEGAVRPVDEAHLDRVGARGGDGEPDPSVLDMGTQGEDRHDRPG